MRGPLRLTSIPTPSRIRFSLIVAGAGPTGKSCTATAVVNLTLRLAVLIHQPHRWPYDLRLSAPKLAHGTLALQFRLRKTRSGTDVAHTRYAGNCIRDDSEGPHLAGLPVFLRALRCRESITSEVIIRLSWLWGVAED